MTKPILFSGAMVRAILDGRKDLTRRVVKLKHRPFIDPLPYQPGDHLWVRETWALANFSTDERGYIDSVEEYEGLIPKKKPDKYWSVAYNAGYDDIRHDQDDRLIKKWRPSIFMPRWASRITLEITGVRVERLQDITEEDAIREGIERESAHGQDFGWKNYLWHGHFGQYGMGNKQSDSWEWQHSTYKDGKAVGSFSSLWELINGKKYPWDSNPYVWVVKFKRLDGKG